MTSLLGSSSGCVVLMQLVQHLDIPYISSVPQDAFHTFDIFIQKRQDDTPHTSALVCFIHGGAWRTEDKADHTTMARNLALSTGYPVAVPNYRLTPREPTPEHFLHHPAHAQDLLRFLEFVLSWDEGNGGRFHWEPTRLFLIGHSCAAHMLCTVFLRMPGDPESVRPSDELFRSTTAIIASEGIYDIDLLLSSFPEYRTWFIENTFGRRDSYENVSAMKAAVDPRGLHIRWFIIHSKADSLVDERQSQGIYDFLRKKSGLVCRSFDDLEDEHDDILKSPQYVDIVDKCIKGLVGAFN